MENLLKNFRAISAIPRGSGNEFGVASFIMNFAEKCGWKAQIDGCNNVLIMKSGSEAATILLQAHLDMVCSAEPGSKHDFKNDPIEVFEENGWLKARGTTLGADNGLGLAMCMCLMEENKDTFSSLKFLMTSGEEKGMIGALNLGFSREVLNARYMINLDSGWDHTLVDGCAGGCIVSVNRKAARGEALGRRNVSPEEKTIYLLEVSGLSGGHSGLNIVKSPGNAIINLCEVLGDLLSEKKGPSELDEGIYLLDISGGEAENAIPKSCRAVLASDRKIDAEILSRKWQKKLKKRFGKAEPDVKISFSEIAMGEETEVFSLFSEDLMESIRLVMELPNYVLAFDDAGFPLTSSNVGTIKFEEGVLKIGCQLRSNLNDGVESVIKQIQKAADMHGAFLEKGIPSPVWQAREKSRIRDVFAEAWQKLYGITPDVIHIHASLESAILADYLGGIDTISIGAETVGAHTYEEKASIESLDHTYCVLQEVLENMQ